MAYIDTKYLGQCETCRHHRSGKCDTWCEWGECYRPDVSKIPTADVAEVKHGEWKKRKNEKKCSMCKFIYYSNNDEWNYCPNCGAKMGASKKEITTK